MSVLLPHADENHALPPPQFGLRTMFIALTLLSGLFAVSVVVGPAWSGMLAFILLFALAHVIGNALGTRLRDGKSIEDVRLAREHHQEQSPCGIRLIAPARRLQENTSLRRPWLVAATLTAAVFGTVGGIVIAAIVGEKLTIPGLALGIGSAAVVGGLFGFMVCSFWTVARTALREALETPEESAAVAVGNEPQENSRELN